MKRAGICFWMMAKRMSKRMVYWILLLLFPAALFVVPSFNRSAKEEQIIVGYVMEGIESPEMSGSERDKSFDDQRIFCLLDEKLSGTLPEKGEDQGLFQYKQYMDKNIMIRNIRTGEISCGIAFDEDFARKLLDQNYRNCITLYLPEGMNVGGMVQEDVFRQVYQVYSAVWFSGLLSEQGVQRRPEEVLRKFSEFQKDGKVFAVSYEGDGRENRELQKMQESVEDRSEVSVLSLRSILAFLTLLSATLGTLEGSHDRKKGVGKGICYPALREMAVVGVPILLATLFLLGGMLYGDTIIDIREGISYELVSALLYGLILWLLAMFFVRIFPEKLLEGMMPFFLLVVLLCCPIFFDLGERISLAEHISKLFPITWYLEFWGG